MSETTASTEAEASTARPGAVAMGVAAVAALAFTPAVDWTVQPVAPTFSVFNENPLAERLTNAAHVRCSLLVGMLALVGAFAAPWRRAVTLLALGCAVLNEVVAWGVFVVNAGRDFLVAADAATSAPCWPSTAAGSASSRCGGSPTRCGRSRCSSRSRCS